MLNYIQTIVRELTLMINENFKFVVKEVKYNEVDISNENREIMICLENISYKSTIPHPFTDYIKSRFSYYGKSLNSQLLSARIICRFLNYLIQQVDNRHPDFVNLKSKGIYNLNLYHGSMYISTLTQKGLKVETVKQTDRTLTSFYLYLKEFNYINTKLDIEYYNVNNQKTPKSLFRKSHLMTRYPSRRNISGNKTKLKDFGKNRYQLVPLFIQLAREVAPDIALGVCLQFFGGLRRGEVVNLCKSDIQAIVNESLIVHIKDNRKKLFSHLQETSNEYPKRLNYLNSNMCKQVILTNPLLWEVFEEHEENFKKRSIKTINLYKDAYFLNNDNKPMTGKVYERRFKKLKEAFLIELLNNKLYEDYQLLNETYWSTHIGRGIYSNFLFDMGLTTTQIAIARGDRNINSAMAYVDEKTTITAINNSLNEIKNIGAKEGISL